MTKYRINKIIAEEMLARGVFLRADVSRDAAVHFESKDAIGSHRNMFLDSLDSCALFEKSLSEARYVDYICERMRTTISLNFSWNDLAALDKHTPAQRCEAFLRTIDKWEEK